LLGVGIHRLVHIHGSGCGKWGSSSNSCIGAGWSRDGVAPALWEVGTTSVSIGVEEVSFVLLEAGGLPFRLWELAKKFRRLPSYLEGPDFWCWGHGGREGLTSKRGGSLLEPGKSVGEEWGRREVVLWGLE